MRFWDSSAVVPLLVREPRSGVVHTLVAEDPEMIVAWTTPIECASALARHRRDGDIDVTAESSVLALLRELGEAWAEIQPTESVRLLTYRLLRTHPLRAADALQLASALAWSGQPHGDVFITFDGRLGAAAGLEGFTVLPAPGEAA